MLFNQLFDYLESNLEYKEKGQAYMTFPLRSLQTNKKVIWIAQDQPDSVPQARVKIHVEVHLGGRKPPCSNMST